jgi:hypothetical protein
MLKNTLELIMKITLEIPKQEKMQNAYKKKFGDLLTKEKQLPLLLNSIRQKEKAISNPNASQQVKSNARKAAQTAVGIDEGMIKIPGGYAGFISVSARG